MAITAPDLTTAAQLSNSKVTAELDDAFGHAGNGLVVLYEDETVPQHQKINFLRSLGDRMHQGVHATVATLTGRPDALLAIGGDAGTPDQVITPPAPPVDTTEIDGLKAKIAEVKTWITDNGGSLVGDDLAAGVNNVLRTKEAAAATLPANQVKKVDIKANITAALAAANAPKDDGGFRKSAILGSTDMVISKEKYDAMIAELNKIETAVA